MKNGSTPVASSHLGGQFTFPGTSLTVRRVGFGTMKLPGPGVFGPPKDHAVALAILREAVDAGVNHLDTADFYGPHVSNNLIREALHPYPDDLVIVTKLGGARGVDGSWRSARSKAQLVEATHDNLRNLGVDTLDVVNLRVSGGENPSEASFEEQLTTLAELQQSGLIRHIGLSAVTAKQIEQGRTIAPIVCVQNEYNIAHRSDDRLIDDLRRDGIAYVPFFPLGGFTPLQSSSLSAIASRLDATPEQIALSWLLHRSPNILLIPGTSSLIHLRENLSAANVPLSSTMLTDLSSAQ